MKPIIEIIHRNEFCDAYVFSTGKKLRVNCGYIGLNPFFEVSEGYDGGLDEFNYTKSEAIEMADYMIELWKEFKKRAENNT